MVTPLNAGCIILKVQGGVGRKRQDDSQDEVLQIPLNDCFNIVFGAFSPATEICGHRSKQPSFPRITFTS